MRSRELTTLDVSQLMQKALEWKETLNESNPFTCSGTPDLCSSPF